MRRELYSALACCLFLIGCPAQPQSMSVEEMQVALEQSSLSSQAETLLADGVEVSTNFTIGSALDKAAEELKAFVVSQLPCAEITRDGATLSITYAANGGNCSFHGHTFAGQHSIRVMRNAANEVAVHHEWHAFNDGRVAIDGSADVTWNRTSKSRHVQHAITWTMIAGRYKGQTGAGSGDRTQTALEAGLAIGMRVDGMRAWDGHTGHFDLDIDGVEMRWNDPVPQSGAYVLTTPQGRTLSLTFARIDSDSINVSAQSDTQKISFAVMADGRVER